MEKLNIGQILTIKEDFETEGCFGTKKLRKKGSKVFVMACKERPMAQYLNGDMQIISNKEIDGYSVNGIAEWIYLSLKNRIELECMLEDYENTKEEFKEFIADALEELGMYDNTGNRS